MGCGIQQIYSEPEQPQQIQQLKKKLNLQPLQTEKLQLFNTYLIDQLDIIELTPTSSYLKMNNQVEEFQNQLKLGSSSSTFKQFTFEDQLSPKPIDSYRRRVDFTEDLVE